MDLSPSVALDDNELDREHAVFELHIHMFAAAAGDEVIRVLEDLRAHAAAHFSKEDAELRRFTPSNAECHLKEHAAVLKSLSEALHTLSSPATSPSLAEALQEDLASELMRWLPGHIAEMDQGIAKSRTQERYGGVAIKLMRRPI